MLGRAKEEEEKGLFFILKTRNYILECLGGLSGYKFNGPVFKPAYISLNCMDFGLGIHCLNLK